MTTTQRYNKVIMDIALSRKGIKANSMDELTKKDWEVLIDNADGDEAVAVLAVRGYFDSVGSEYLENY